MENINNILKMADIKRRKIKVKDNLRTIKDENGFVRIDPRFLANS